MTSSGIQYPVISSLGKPSSVYTGKAIVAAALCSVDVDAGEDVIADSTWREGGYTRHFVKSLQLSAKGKYETLKIANAGLDYCYSNFEFNGVKLKDVVVDMKSRPSFHTAVVKGNQKRASFDVPVGGENISQAQLLRTLKKWKKKGVAEPEAVDAVERFLNNQEDYCKYLKANHLFVVMGAGAAMGPFEILLKLGLSVVAIDLDRPAIWERLIKAAENSPGTLYYPVRTMQDGQTVPGCNLMTDIVDVSKWLGTLLPQYNMTLGNYAYVDGQNFVKIVLAMDFISKTVYEHRAKDSKCSLAYLCSPTDAFFWPTPAIKQSKQMYANRSYSDAAASMVSIQRFCQSNEGSQAPPAFGHRIIECFVTQQGPNYALAKRIQHWRALVARNLFGVSVSTNVAPSSSTASVTSNTLLAAAYEGTKNFPPLEIFEPGTSNSLMTAMLIEDICNTESVAHSNVPLEHPLYLFSSGAWHGGFWRCPYKLSSIVEYAALFGLSKRYEGFLWIALGIGLISAKRVYHRSRL